ncbi:alpha/beta fold hydrolase [Rothia aerolata]|uniref:Alpha/beta hydrolase n=1 Tax=Rothia aerolata TaxID=1812262 RepID=A0A917IL46_9MICC|nr:alpha/beta hydrolase [Rothia aerolata]GGH57685.1 alpha/beta hydrolase [Rothia aerolata]
MDGALASQQPIFESVPREYSGGTMREIMIQGARTRFWEYGNPQGSPLVLIHGFRGDHHGLELIAAGLGSFRVIIPDLPGFGRSEPIPGAEHTVSTYASWLIDFVGAVAPREPVHLVGHSFGSIICSYALNARPGFVAALSLINPICQPALEGDQRLVSALATLYYDAGARLPAPLGFRLLRSGLVTRLSSEFMMKNSDPELRKFINGQHDAYFGAFSSRETVLQAYRASITHTAAEFSSGIREPVQMIVAEKDDLGSLELQHQMFAGLKKGRFDLIPAVGHLIHYETPLRAATLLTDFHSETVSKVETP